MKFRLEGVIPALLTPFTKNGERPDYEKACALALRLAGQGVQGVFPGGTTGEGLLMSVEERKTLIEEIVGAAGSRLKVIAHTGALDTATTVALTRHARDAGAYAAGVVTPGFYSYDDASLAAHLKAVAKAVPGFPVLLYNIPGCAKNVLSPKLIVKLASEVDNIVGLKDSAGDMAALTAVLGNAPKGFHVINGVDEYTFQALVAGAKGSVSSTANVVPELFLGVFNNVKRGNLKKAWTLQVKLSRMCGWFQYGRMVAFYKEGLRLRGFDAGYLRAPQRALTASERKGLAKALEEEGII